jgi:hypothetical protein
MLTTRVFARATSVAAVLVLVVAAAGFTSRSATASPLPEAPACPMFPADSFWHADVSQLPVDTNSSAYVASAGAASPVHADFGSGIWNGAPIGIPYNVVPGGQPPVAVSFDYASESDAGPYPIPANPLIEGGPSSTGDRHILVVNKDACQLSELYSAYPQPGGSWHAGSGAVWSLTSNALRPSGWTSADAAGLAILPGLVRYDEVASGVIDHAVRVTVPATDARFIWPARHQAGHANAALAPMGLRLRLKAGVNISGYSAANQVILTALKRYGAIIADNGSPWFVSGAPDNRWNNDDLHLLGQIKGSDFEAVNESSLMVDPNSGAVTAPAPAQTIQVATPNGGESWARRVSHTIAWSYSGGSGSAVRIQLLKAGRVQATIVASTPLGSNGSGTYNWTPRYQAAGSTYQIRLTILGSTPVATDASDANFQLT